MNELMKNADIAQSWVEGMETLRDAMRNADPSQGYHSVLHNMLKYNPSSEEPFPELLRKVIRNPWFVFKENWTAPPYDPGYVYLLHADNHLFKIGKSKRPLGRTGDIGLVMPNEVHLVKTIFTDSMDFYERHLHEIFRHRRVRGEWFRLSWLDFLFFFVDDDPAIYARCHMHKAEDAGSEKAMMAISGSLCAEQLPQPKSYEDRYKAPWE